jgi:arabinofuranan 3-O-arabinosyltransferase
MQQQTEATAEQKAADRRVADLAGKGVWPVVALGAAITVICTVLTVANAYVLTSGDGPRALSNDFRVFWAAGQLALEGDFLGVFDTDKLTAVHNVSPEYWMPWLYPPGFLFAVAPLGALSYATAFTIMTILSLVLLAAAVRPFTGGSRTAWVAFSLAPACVPILVEGQNGLIWLAGLLAALAALQDKRWFLAGLLIGLLTLKPHFGLMIPVALIAAGLWRTTGVATLTAIVVAGLPTLATGANYWTLLLQQIDEHGQRVVASIQSLEFMASPFSLFVRLGVPPDAALMVQAGVTIAAGVAVLIVWRSDTVAFDVKAAALLCGTLLASPYAWHYESAIMAPIGLFLLRGGVLQSRPLHLILLAVLWLGAVVQTLVDLVGDGNLYFRWAFLVPPVLFFCLALCVAQVRTTSRSSVGAA